MDLDQTETPMKIVLLLLVSTIFVSIDVNAQQTIAGHVLSLDTGEPISGAVLTLKDASGLALPHMNPATTDSDGYYAFDHVSSGRYTLHARAKVDFDGAPSYFVLVSAPFDAGAKNVTAHVGYSFAGLRAGLQLSLAEQGGTQMEQDGTRGPVRVEGVSSLTIARMQLLRSIIAIDGQELITASFPERGQP